MTSVALLHYSCAPVVGGVEEVLRQQAQLLAQHGHEVSIIAGAGGTTAGPDERNRGTITVRIHPLLASGAFEALDTESVEAVQEASARVEAVLDEALGGADVVFAHNVLSMPFNLPLTIALRGIAARGRRGGHGRTPPVVGWNHDSPYFAVDSSPHLERDPWRVLRDPHRAIRWVTISEARAREFSGLYGGLRPQVVPNGIDPHSFLKLEAPISALVRDEGLLDADLVLVQPSRLHPRKNVELSLRVLAALRERAVDARLLVTGAHDPHDPAAAGYAGNLQQLALQLGISEAVVMLADHVSADGTRMVASQLAIRDLYQVADVLFLPSISEGFGLPLLEAALIRLPIACSDIPPLQEVAGADAYRFAPDCPPEQIAEEVLAYLDALPTYRLHRRVIREHAWEHVYRAHLRPLLRDLAVL